MRLKLSFFIVFTFIIIQGFAAVRQHPFRHQSTLKCKKCRPGWGVVSPCSANTDTICKRCPLQYYSKHNSYKQSCFPCSLCGGGLFEAHPCTPRSDTVCDSCDTVVKPHSKDYFVKCLNGSSGKLREGENSDMSVQRKDDDDDDDEVWMASKSSQTEYLGHELMSKLMALNESDVSVMRSSTKEKARSLVMSSAKSTSLKNSSDFILLTIAIATGSCAVSLTVMHFIRKRKMANFQGGKYKGLESEQC